MASSAGFTYWFPKFTGFFLDEKFNRYAFWCWFVGFLLAFMPLYMLGFMGATRRLDHYEASTGWHPLFVIVGDRSLHHCRAELPSNSLGSSGASITARKIGTTPAATPGMEVRWNGRPIRLRRSTTLHSSRPSTRSTPCGRYKRGQAPLSKEDYEDILPA